MDFEQRMKIAALVLEYLSALAWPVVVLVLAGIFRKHIGDIVKRITHADLPGGLKINLKETIEDAERLSEDVAEIEPPPGKRGIPSIPVNEANARMIKVGLQPSPSGLDLNYYRDLANQDPNIALVGLRIELEIMTNNLAKGFNVPLSQGRMPLSRLVHELYKNNAITIQQRQLIEKVSTVCNLAVHGEPISMAETLQVIESVEILAKQYTAWLSWGFE